MIDRVLLLSLGGCAVFGTLLFFELTVADNAPAHDDQQAASGVAPKAPPAAQVQRPQLDDLVATILSRPLFSPTRKPPEQAAAAGRPIEEELPNIRLTGIIIDQDRRLAIFAVPGAKPLVRTEGEMVDDWKLDSIRPRQVSLSGPTGITTLEPKTDPNIIRPAPAAPTGATPGQPGRPGRPPAPPLRPASAPPGPVTPTQQR